MDPASAAGIAISLASLALRIGTVATTFRDVVRKYKKAEFTVELLAQNLDIFGQAWKRIGLWLQECAEAGSILDNDTIESVKRSLKIGTLVMDDFEKDLETYHAKKLNFSRRSNLILDDKILRDHQTRIGNQIHSMSLLLLAVNLPTPKGRSEMFQRPEDQSRIPSKDPQSIESGYLLRPDKFPTPIFEELLLGVAHYIKKSITSWDTQLTPKKLATFYKQVGGNWDSLFRQTSQDSLTFLYQTLDCDYTIESEKGPHAPVAVPALTPAGFARWQRIQLLLRPEEHVAFLQTAVRSFILTNPTTGASFPSVLPKENLPSQPDEETTEWFMKLGEKVESGPHAAAWRKMQRGCDKRSSFLGRKLTGLLRYSCL